jgi:hypothetical protein
MLDIKKAEQEGFSTKEKQEFASATHEERMRLLKVKRDKRPITKAEMQEQDASNMLALNLETCAKDPDMSDTDKCKLQAKRCLSNSAMLVSDSDDGRNCRLLPQVIAHNAKIERTKQLEEVKARAKDFDQKVENMEVDRQLASGRQPEMIRKMERKGELAGLKAEAEDKAEELELRKLRYQVKNPAGLREYNAKVVEREQKLRDYTAKERNYKKEVDSYNVRGGTGKEPAALSMEKPQEIPIPWAEPSKDSSAKSGFAFRRKSVFGA